MFRKIFTKELEGSYTFEAVFVFIIVLISIIGILYLSLYVHDLCVLESESKSRFTIWLDNDKYPKEKQWQNDFINETNEKLFIYRIMEVKTREKGDIQEICIKYDMSISWIFLKNILMNGKKEKEINIEFKKSKPAKRMWLYGNK